MYVKNVVSLFFFNLLGYIVEKESNTNTITKENLEEPTNYEAKAAVEQNSPQGVTLNKNDRTFESKETLGQTGAPQSTNNNLYGMTASQEAQLDAELAAMDF